MQSLWDYESRWSAEAPPHIPVAHLCVAMSCAAPVHVPVALRLASSIDEMRNWCTHLCMRRMCTVLELRPCERIDHPITTAPARPVCHGIRPIAAHRLTPGGGGAAGMKSNSLLAHSSIVGRCGAIAHMNTVAALAATDLSIEFRCAPPRCIRGTANRLPGCGSDWV